MPATTRAPCSEFRLLPCVPARDGFCDGESGDPGDREGEPGEEVDMVTLQVWFRSLICLRALYLILNIACVVGVVNAIAVDAMSTRDGLA